MQEATATGFSRMLQSLQRCFVYIVSRTLAGKCPLVKLDRHCQFMSRRRQGQEDERVGRLSGLVGEASDFSSGHDITVRGFEPHVRLHPDSGEPAWNSFSPSLSAPPLLALLLSLKINK